MMYLLLLTIKCLGEHSENKADSSLSLQMHLQGVSSKRHSA